MATEKSERWPSPLTAVILAAGAGRRLEGYEGGVSKAMVRIAGRPLIEWVVERLKAAEIADLIVVAHAEDHLLQQRIRRRMPGVRLALQEHRRGTADGVVQALHMIDPPRSYLACACDSLFEPADIAAVVRTGLVTPGAAVVAVQRMGVAATAARSAVELHGQQVVRIVEKPAPGTTASPLVALPLYWLTPAVTPYLLKAAPLRGEKHVTTALNDFAAGGGHVLAVCVPDRIEITTAADVQRAEQRLHQQAHTATTSRRAPC